MSRKNEALLIALQESFGDSLLSAQQAFNEITLETTADRSYAVCQSLRDTFGFAQLVDLCGIDYLEYGQADWETHRSSAGFSRGVSKGAHQDSSARPARFAVVYHLLSLEDNQRLRLRVYTTTGDMPMLPSVIGLWKSADWYEREAFDLYGILFEGHPDLRRILTDYGFIGHPFRKDFPLSGHVEMRYDPEKGRVVYEPVSIEPRVLVPRVIR